MYFGLVSLHLLSCSDVPGEQHVDPGAAVAYILILNSPENREGFCGQIFFFFRDGFLEGERKIIEMRSELKKGFS